MQDEANIIGHRLRPCQRNERALDRAALFEGLGVKVTICIAAKTYPADYIVAVSDRMISFDDKIPAADSAALKTLHIARYWVILFAAKDYTKAWDVIQRVSRALHGSDDHGAAHVIDTVCKAYREAVVDEIVGRILFKIGFNSISELVVSPGVV